MDRSKRTIQEYQRYVTWCHDHDHAVGVRDAFLKGAAGVQCTPNSDPKFEDQHPKCFILLTDVEHEQGQHGTLSCIVYHLGAGLEQRAGELLQSRCHLPTANSPVPPSSVGKSLNLGRPSVMPFM